MVEKQYVKWGVGQRFEFIEWRCYWVGRVNRSDLEERFGVSTPQASLDLRAYQEAMPASIEYDMAEKAYVPQPGFQPSYLKLSADRYLIQLDAILNGAIPPGVTWFGSAPPSAVIPSVARSIEPGTLRAILRAIDRRLELEVEYQSLTNTRRRMIAPHALAFDGYRWHARAWCVEHNDFRDFVLSRILSVGPSRSSKADPTNDVEWNTLVHMKITAHPALDAAQKSAIERDFGMKDGVRTIETKAALTFYLERRMNLDLDDEAVKPERKQIFLANLEEVRQARLSAKEESKRRVAAALGEQT